MHGAQTQPPLDPVVSPARSAHTDKAAKGKKGILYLNDIVYRKT